MKMIYDKWVFFEELELLTLDTGTQLRIWLSSRRYPHISIRTELSLVVEDQTGHDSDIVLDVLTTLHGDHCRQMNDL